MGGHIFKNIFSLLISQFSMMVFTTCLHCINDRGLECTFLFFASPIDFNAFFQNGIKFPQVLQMFPKISEEI